MRVAIVHDWLVGGGAEQVVLALHHLYPEAPIYTSYATPEWREKLDNKVVTGYLQAWPFSKLRKFIPMLRASWFSRLKLHGYDLVISSSGAEAKGIRVPKGTIHINYCHAPTHYYWSRYDEYLKHPGFGPLDPLARLGLRLFVGPLRRWDYKAAQRPDYMLANSTHIKHEIKKYYGRDAEVIFPPVAIDRFKSTRANERHGFVITGRQTPYKRFDLAVQACTELGLPLTVVGDGPDHAKLRRLAGPSVAIVGWLPRDEVIKRVQTAEAFIFPGVDDFGISAVEALAAGTPLIAYKAGGALDYVIEGESGMFFAKQDVASLVKTLSHFQATDYTPAKVQAVAERFSEVQFEKHWQAFVDSVLS